MAALLTRQQMRPHSNPFHNLAVLKGTSQYLGRSDLQDESTIGNLHFHAWTKARPRNQGNGLKGGLLLHLKSQ